MELESDIRDREGSRPGDSWSDTDSQEFGDEDSGGLDRPYVRVNRRLGAAFNAWRNYCAWSTGLGLGGEEEQHAEQAAEGVPDVSMAELSTLLDAMASSVNELSVRVLEPNAKLVPGPEPEPEPRLEGISDGLATELQQLAKEAADSRSPHAIAAAGERSPSLDEILATGRQLYDMLSPNSSGRSQSPPTRDAYLDDVSSDASAEVLPTPDAAGDAVAHKIPEAESTKEIGQGVAAAAKLAAAEQQARHEAELRAVAERAAEEAQSEAAAQAASLAAATQAKVEAEAQAVAAVTAAARAAADAAARVESEVEAKYKALMEEQSRIADERLAAQRLHIEQSASAQIAAVAAAVAVEVDASLGDAKESTVAAEASVAPSARANEVSQDEQEKPGDGGDEKQEQEQEEEEQQQKPTAEAATAAVVFYATGADGHEKASLRALASKLARGQIEWSTPVWCNGMDEWAPLEDAIQNENCPDLEHMSWHIDEAVESLDGSDTELELELEPEPEPEVEDGDDDAAAATTSSAELVDRTHNDGSPKKMKKTQRQQFLEGLGVSKQEEEDAAAPAAAPAAAEEIAAVAAAASVPSVSRDPLPNKSIAPKPKLRPKLDTSVPGPPIELTEETGGHGVAAGAKLAAAEQQARREAELRAIAERAAEEAQSQVVAQAAALAAATQAKVEAEAAAAQAVVDAEARVESASESAKEIEAKYKAILAGEHIV
jgi:hypothetical protein